MFKKLRERLESPKNPKSFASVLRLTESGIMLAIATVLSLFKITDLPFGGSVTICSMLPIILIAYRYGTRWGLFTAFAGSLLQLVLGLSSFNYGKSFGAVITIALLDYIIAFMVLGLGGIFVKRSAAASTKKESDSRIIRFLRSDTMALVEGVLLVCTLRYLCHVLSGCTVWAGISIPSVDAWWFSMGYNATYMIPETIVTIIGAVAVSRFYKVKSLYSKLTFVTD